MGINKRNGKKKNHSLYTLGKNSEKEIVEKPLARLKDFINSKSSQSREIDIAWPYDI